MLRFSQQIILFLLLGLVATTVPAQDCTNAGDREAGEQIRQQRHSFNLAIAQGDIGGVEAALHEKAILVTGTNSDLSQGRERQVELWKQDFAKAERAIYVRSPHCIRVSPLMPIALETGGWRGIFNSDPNSFAAGSYAAKWRQLDGMWLLESEIFVTEECGGTLCP